MSSTENGLNTMHLNRPAVVLFRKPLATNDEMTAELEKLIGSAFPFTQKTFKSIDGKGKLKAIFYHPADKNPETCYRGVGYNENVVFHTTVCKQNDPEKVNKKFGDFDIESYTQVQIESIEARIAWHRKVDSTLLKIKDAFSNFYYNYTPGGILYKKWLQSHHPQTSRNWEIKPRAFFSDLMQMDDALEESLEYHKGSTQDRTWYVFSFDENYYVPEMTYKGVENLDARGGIAEYTDPMGRTKEESFPVSNLKIDATATLNPNVIYSTEKISIGEFEKQVKPFAQNGYYLNQKLKDHKIVAIYKIILQEYTTYYNPEVMTYKYARNMVGKLLEQNKKYTQIHNILCELRAYYMDHYGFQSGQLYRNNEQLQKDVAWAKKPIKETFPGDVNQYLQTNKLQIPVTKFLDLATIKVSGQKTKLSRDIIESDIAPGWFGSYSLADNTDLAYVSGGGENGGLMVFPEYASFQTVVQGYLNIAFQFNKERNATSADTDHELMQQFYNLESPLRYINQKTLSGAEVTITATSLPYKYYQTYQTNNTVIKERMEITPLTVNTKIQAQALEDSYGMGKIGETRLVEKTVTQRKGKSTDVKMLDFKIMYYMMIKYNVILPKYNKLEYEFIHGNNKNSTVRMFPTNFFEATGAIESANRERVDMGDGIIMEDIVIDFDSISQLSTTSKQTLADIYENVYYGDWAGFYYTNATAKLEDVAPYTNTKLSDTILTTVQEKLNATTESISSLDKLKEANAKRRYLTELNDIKNTDVSDIIVSRQTMGKSQATISLKNTNRKYNFQQGIFKGDCIFEPMDEVSVYLPNFDGSVTLSFKGLISAVENVITNGYHQLVLQCDCPMKLLEIVRTNVKPSMQNEEERDYIPVNPFELPPSFFTSVENWVPFLFTQGLTYFTSMLGDIESPASTLVYENAILSQEGNFKIYYPKFNDPLLQYLWSRKSSHDKDVAIAHQSLTTLLHLYTDTVTYKNGEDVAGRTQVAGCKPLSNLYTLNEKSNNRDYKKIEYFIYAQRRDSRLYTKYIEGKNDDKYKESLANRRLVARMAGTLQPAFALGYKSIPIVFSDYKTNLELLMSTAEKFNFFLYSNRKGVVEFVPPLVSLTSLNFRPGADPIQSRNKTVNYDYNTTDPNIINYQTAINFRESCDDSKLVNWMQIAGGFVQSASIDAASSGIAATVCDYPSTIKYGFHPYKKQAITGITNQAALHAYAFSLMDRNNKNFKSATCDAVGSGDTDINTTVYSAINNTIYLRTGLNASYKAGQSFVTSSTLNWGRKPLCPFNSDVELVKNNFSLVKRDDVSVDTWRTGGLDFTKFSQNLDELFNKNFISSAYYNQVKGVLEATKTNQDYELLLYSFIFNGYFWEGVPSISFEDLSTEYYSKNVTNGLDVPIVTLSTDGTMTVNTQQPTKSPVNNVIDQPTNLKSGFVGLFGMATPSKLQKTFLK